MSYYNQQQHPVGVPPPQGYPPEGYPPKDAYPPPGYPPQGYPPQSYPPQGYPPPQYAQPQPQPQPQQNQSSGCIEGCVIETFEFVLGWRCVAVWPLFAVAVFWRRAFEEQPNCAGAGAGAGAVAVAA
ncbi:hypothetical protein V6N13_029927 [Hibiscus sabdariffa]|uniref:Uncharacterized protein n=2 Tax=Hibiscus sabdariffa TaxID=183260 RepID=A0ABR2AHU8_9ROSI